MIPLFSNKSNFIFSAWLKYDKVTLTNIPYSRKGNVKVKGMHILHVHVLRTPMIRVYANQFCFLKLKKWRKHVFSHFFMRRLPMFIIVIVWSCHVSSRFFLHLYTSFHHLYKNANMLETLSCIFFYLQMTMTRVKKYSRVKCVIVHFQQSRSFLIIRRRRSIMGEQK